jgi:hypothetical protein
LLIYQKKKEGKKEGIFLNKKILSKQHAVNFYARKKV